MEVKDLDIIEIPQDEKYQGYLWPSDQTEPIVCGGSKTLNDEISYFYKGNKIPDFKGNPFIIEGFLFNAKGKSSITIKYAGGKYLVKEYSDFAVDNDNVRKYHSNRMDNRILKFMQNWTSVPDDNCCGFNVLQPAELVFVGFDN